MNAEYIPLDDPRVTLHCTRLGRVYTLDGPEWSEAHPYRHTTHANGLHQEPRMPSVMAPVRTWNLNAGDWCELEVEDVALLGIVLELAEHHWDCDLYVDGEKIYGEFYCVSTYMPSSDGYGYIHWLMLDRGRHTIRLTVSGERNQMHDVCDIEATHACINGFLLLPDLAFPPPLSSTWMFGQAPLPGDKRNAKGSLRDNVIPAGGYLTLMDLYGRGTLDTLACRLSAPLILEVLDGGVAQAEFNRDFPSWLRRVNLAHELDGTLTTTVVDVAERPSGAVQLRQHKSLAYGSRLIVRLYNPFSDDHEIDGLYMEGTVKCM